ncbi:hypothetical protein AAGG74_07750 [Bacillus mexicanus]|uniref:hypothetical protein n=1 Tax=Bacillus mexicanus TaxID=2834415 RepID=UPI003D261422
MINVFDMHPHAYSYIEGLEVTERGDSFALSACANYENGFDEPFQMKDIEFDVVPDTERPVVYGLHIVLIKETQKMEYKLFRRIADEDGYNYDYIDSTEYRLMKNILSVTVYPNGETAGTFFKHQKKELEQ